MGRDCLTMRPSDLRTCTPAVPRKGERTESGVKDSESPMERVDQLDARDVR